MFYGLITSQWKESIRKMAPSNEEVESASRLTLFSTKMAYVVLLDRSHASPTAETKILSYVFRKDNIYRVYTLPFRILTEVNLIIFQYKIIHNILPTQSRSLRGSFIRLIIDPHIHLLPVSQIAQLGEHCTSIAEVRVRIAVQA